VSKPSPDKGRRKPKAVAADTRVEPSPVADTTPGRARAADDTVEVTNPMAQLPRRRPGAWAPAPTAQETRVDRPAASAGREPSLERTIPLPCLPDEEVAQPLAAPGAEPRSAAPAPRPERREPAPLPGKTDGLAERATVLKVTPETIRAWLEAEGGTGLGEDGRAPGGPRPLIEDLKEELEAEAARAAEPVPAAPPSPGRDGRKRR